MNISKAKKCDIKIMSCVYELYKDKDIASEITKNMQMVSFPKEINYQNVDKYLKAIRQDLRKIFLAVENIEKIYTETQNYSYDRETIGLFIEYIFSKYRTILDYVYKIADLTLTIEYSKNKLRDYEKFNELLDSLKENIPDDERRKLLNTTWFSDIRKTRNSIIHNGATCLVFQDKTKKIFQIYDLEVNELVVDKEMYLHEGNCIYFDYYLALNISYLLYFINIVFSLIVEKGTINEEQKELSERYGFLGENIGHLKQDTYMALVGQIIHSYKEEGKVNGNRVDK